MGKKNRIFKILVPCLNSLMWLRVNGEGMLQLIEATRNVGRTTVIKAE